MKKFSILEGAKKLEIQGNSINYISSANLKKYLEIADKFISPATKSIVNYLIVHNNDYINTLGSDLDDNALVAFYNGPVPKDPELKELYQNIGKVVKSGRILEIPVFQTPEQFTAIITKEESPDAIIMDLESESGRAMVAKKYEPMVHKICRQWLGKSNLDYDSLLSAAYTGLTYAMNNYGKKTNHTKVDDDKIVQYSFTQYAAYMIRAMILDDIKNLSHTVRIPISQQSKEKKETGRNTKNNSISGDKTIGSGEDGNSKTLFDTISGYEDGGKYTDEKDIDRLWKTIYNHLESKFDKKMMDVWYSTNGLNGYEKIKAKDIAKKYGIVPSNVNYYNYKINTYIQKNPKIMDLLKQLHELTQESLESKSHEEIF